MKRNVFFISDGTGLTAETLGKSLMMQFEEVHFTTKTLPYINTMKKAKEVIEEINQTFEKNNTRPLVFTTLLNPEIRECITECDGKVLDLFQAFLKPIETELDVECSYAIGRFHSVIDLETYQARMNAIHYALMNDDGLGVHNYDKADVIVIGVSRSGKTPTCLYLALQFGTLAANYPLTDDGEHTLRLPESLKAHKGKLFGLTIQSERLHAIRNERRPNSNYSSMDQCRFEVKEVEMIFEHENIPYLDTTSSSIEEISTKLLAITNIRRRVF